jgi:hypothetical protein
MGPRGFTGDQGPPGPVAHIHVVHHRHFEGQQTSASPGLAQVAAHTREASSDVPEAPAAAQVRLCLFVNFCVCMSVCLSHT